MAGMYGAVAKLQVKAGQEKVVRQIFNEWEKQAQPIEHGVNSAYLIGSGDGEGSFYLVVTYESQDAWQSVTGNAAEQRWEHRLAEHLESMPQWQSGQIVATIEG